MLPRWSKVDSLSYLFLIYSTRLGFDVCPRPKVYFITQIVFPTFHLFIHPSVHPSIRPSVHPSIRPSVHPSIRPSIFKKAKNAVNYSIRCAKSVYYRHKLNENVGDQKTTWKVLNDLMGKKSAVTEVNEILTSTNTTLRNAGQIANHFNVHFTEIGPRLAANLPVSATNAEVYLKREPSSFEFAEIKSSRVLKLLCKLDT